MKFHRVLVFSAAFLSGTALTCGTAFAQASPTAKPRIPLPGGVHYRAVYKHDQGAFSGDWAHCLYITRQKSTLSYTCTKTVTVTETITGSAGFTADGISATVGFNVSYSAAVSVGATVRVRPGGHGWLDDGFRYERYAVGMQKRLCVLNDCGRWSATHRVIVQRHLGSTFK